MSNNLNNNFTNLFNFYKQNFNIDVLPLPFSKKRPLSGFLMKKYCKGADLSDCLPNSFDDSTVYNVAFLPVRNKLLVILCNDQNFQRIRNNVGRTLTVKENDKFFMIYANSLTRKYYKKLSRLFAQQQGVSIVGQYELVLLPPSVTADTSVEFVDEPSIAVFGDEQVEQVLELFASPEMSAETVRLSFVNLLTLLRDFCKFYSSKDKRKVIKALLSLSVKMNIDLSYAMNKIASMVPLRYSHKIKAIFSYVDNDFIEECRKIDGLDVLKSIFPEFADEIERLVLSRFSENDEIDDFVRIGSIWYRQKKITTASRRSSKRSKSKDDADVDYENQRVCRYFTIAKVLEYKATGSLSYVIRVLRNNMQFSEIEVPEFEKSLFVKVLGIVSHKDFDELFIGLENRAQFRYVVSSLGFHELNGKTIFVHPALYNDTVHISLPVDFVKVSDFIPPSEQHAKEHLQIIYKLLQEGKLVGAKLVFAFASLFGNMIVHDVAPARMGKTTTSKFVTSVFYKIDSPITLFSTNVARERIFSVFKNMPVLLDEATLTIDKDMETLIFLVASGLGKARGTKELKVKTDKIQSVVFVTSEKELNYSTLGAYRRYLLLYVLGEKDYSEILTIQELADISNRYYASAAKVIEHAVKNSFEVNEYFSLLPYAKTMYNIAVAIDKSLCLLESFYKTEFTLLRKKIEEIIRQQAESANQDYLELFQQSLRNFIEMNKHSHFAVKKYEPHEKKYLITQMPTKSELWGVIEYPSDSTIVNVAIMTEIFEKFCAEHNYPKHTILKKLEKEGILTKYRDNKYRYKYYIGKRDVIHVYYINMSRLETLQEQQESYEAPF